MPRDLFAAMVALTLGATACGKKKSPRHPEDAFTTGSSTRDHREPAETRSDPGSTDPDADRVLTVEPVYFEYDSAELSHEGRVELNKVASWLARHPSAQLRIEGHTDERGTTEYNLGLGESRAQAIADYLYRLGVERARLHTISFGEERPAVEGQTEHAWAKNRRGGLAIDKDATRR
jgi:peptidoglycan-associated lipoprotein